MLACLAAVIAGSAWAQVSSSPSSPSGAVLAPAPAFKAGAMVVDRNGVRLGPVESLAETGATAVAMVVIKIDGKLVSVPQSTLAPKGANVVSTQSKAEILAAAGAPR
jgi:hypothetical protein